MQMRFSQIYPSRLPAVIKALITALCVIPLVGLISGCAYRTGGPDRSLPGGYTQIHIPIFKNKTQEVGIEVGFTNALVQEFERSRSARVVAPQYAEAEVEGEIQSVIYQPGGIQGGDKFPKGSVLASEYRVLLVVRVALKRKSDNAELWSGTFQGERTYVAPQDRKSVV